MVLEVFLYIFSFLYLILPEYFGIELSLSLPILTAARVLILLLFGVSFVYLLKEKRIRIITDRRFWIIIGIYFVLRLAANMYYITTYSDAINAVFKMVVEQLGLLILIPNILSADEKREKTIKAMVYASGLVALFGICESISGVRVFDHLYTVKREMLNDHYIRLGLLRATTSFGISNLMAYYLNMMTPFIFYLAGKTGGKRYIAIGILNFLALVFTGCRANLLAYGAIAVLCFVFADNKDKLRFLKRFLAGAGITLVIMVALRFTGPKLRYYIDGTAKSLLNLVGFDFDLNEGAPEGSGGYGVNEKNAKVSRVFQFTGVKRVMEMNPLFGLGTGAQKRGQIYYIWKGKWQQTFSYDMGYVSIPCDEGIIGSLGYAALFFGILYCYISDLIKEGDEDRKKYLKVFIVADIVFFICMLFADKMMPMYFFINAIGLSSLKCSDIHFRKAGENRSPAAAGVK